MNLDERQDNLRAKRIMMEIMKGMRPSDDGYRAAEELLGPWMDKPDISVVTQVNYAAILSDTGRHQEAIDLLEEVLKSGPDIKEAYMNYGAALLNQGERADEASSVFVAASKYPSHPDAIEAYLDPHAH